MADNHNDRASYLYARDPSLAPCFHRPRPERKVNLFPKIDENSVAEFSGSSSTDTKVDTASVYLRLRPTTEPIYNYSTERNVFKARVLDASGQNNAAHKDSQEKHFTFSDIFLDSASQKDVYNTCCFKAIEDDENLTVLTYGTSGSGKTFTLLGMLSDNPGIIPRAIEHIFSKYSRKVCTEPAIKISKGSVAIIEDRNYDVEANRRSSLIENGGEDDYVQQKLRIQMDHNFQEAFGTNDLVVIWVSFAEIYNENVYDLLVPDASSSGSLGKENIPPRKRKNLKIISNDGNAFIQDLSAIHCRNSSDAYQLLAHGLKNISYASTNINANSSRSHCIFIVEVIKCRNKMEFDNTTYKFCDLAGSERQKKADSSGCRLKEAQSINCSLMVLGRCLDAVYHNCSIVPIRDSKLTVLLQASLLGKEKITMIVNMLPTTAYYEENLNVLNFASMAKQIVYKAPALRKLRSTMRFSWFISKAASSSPKVNRAAGGADDSQVSLLLDENDRLKQEYEEKIAIINEIYVGMDQREMQIKQEMFSEHDERVKRYDAIWNKRLEHQNAIKLQELENVKINFEEIADEMHHKYQNAYKQINDAWEKRLAEFEESHGVKVDRRSLADLQPLMREAKGCAVNNVPIVHNTSLEEHSEEEEMEEDSFFKAHNRSNHRSDESDTSEDSSIDMSIFAQPISGEETPRFM